MTVTKLDIPTHLRDGTLFQPNIDTFVAAARFAQLKRSLPDRATVGYFTDNPADPATSKAFFIAQEVLAPAIIWGSPDYELVVAYLTSDRAGLSDAEKSQFNEIGDYGGGIKLLRRTHRPLPARNSESGS